MEVIFSDRARKDWNRLDRSVQVQLRKKLAFFLESGDPLKFAERLQESSLGEYRFRVGSYRIAFDVGDSALNVLRVGHRKDIYR